MNQIEERMANDYTALDAAIIARITDVPASFLQICASVSKHSERIANINHAPAWRVVDRRLQSMRKAGRIHYQHKPKTGWVVINGEKT